MTLEDFVTLVKDMRTAQKAYFKDRTGATLNKSKRLERLVDDAISKGDIPDGHGYKQSNLFAGPDQSGPYKTGA